MAKETTQIIARERLTIIIMTLSMQAWERAATCMATLMPLPVCMAAAENGREEIAKEAQVLEGAAVVFRDRRGAMINISMAEVSQAMTTSLPGHLTV